MTRGKASRSPVSWRSWPSRVSSTGASCHRHCRTVPRAGRREPPVPWPSVTSWNSPDAATARPAQVWDTEPGTEQGFGAAVTAFLLVKPSEGPGLTEWSIKASYSLVRTRTGQQEGLQVNQNGRDSPTFCVHLIQNVLCPSWFGSTHFYQQFCSNSDVLLLFCSGPRQMEVSSRGFIAFRYIQIIRSSGLVISFLARTSL